RLIICACGIDNLLRWSMGVGVFLRPSDDASCNDSWAILTSRYMTRHHTCYGTLEHEPHDESWYHLTTRDVARPKWGFIYVLYTTHD
ncbi:hypothetical protein HAX54_018706, partial [Datura stramonium]|nr:hypothetical protein [Datura stramonium]